MFSLESWNAIFLARCDMRPAFPQLWTRTLNAVLMRFSDVTLNERCLWKMYDRKLHKSSFFPVLYFFFPVLYFFFLGSIVINHLWKTARRDSSSFKYIELFLLNKLTFLNDLSLFDKWQLSVYQLKRKNYIGDRQSVFWFPFLNKNSRLEKYVCRCGIDSKLLSGGLRKSFGSWAYYLLFYFSSFILCAHAFLGWEFRLLEPRDALQLVSLVPNQIIKLRTWGFIR